MSHAEKIECYLRDLSRALSSLSDFDRTEILQEIRAHLEQRDSEDRLDEALAALGAPKVCAQNFYEEIKLQDAFTDGGPTKTIGALAALASRRVTAALGLLFAGVFFLIAAGLSITAISEIVVPELAGLWVNVDAGIFFFGVVDRATTVEATEILGAWVIPVAASLAVLALVCGQWLGRFFIRLMMRDQTR